MRRLIPILIAALALAAPAHAQTAWVPYKDADGHFTAAFPADPKTSDIMDGSGRRKLDLIVELSDDEAYLLSATVFPSGTEAGTPTAQVLDKVQAAARADFPNAVPLRSEPVPMGEWQGREFAMKLDNGLIYRARIFWTGTRLYQVVTVVGEKRGADKSVRRFLDSFKILRD